jgi:uncharacterized membrane protein
MTMGKYRLCISLQLSAFVLQFVLGAGFLGHFLVPVNLASDISEKASASLDERERIAFMKAGKTTIEQACRTVLESISVRVAICIFVLGGLQGIAILLLLSLGNANGFRTTRKPSQDNFERNS